MDIPPVAPGNWVPAMMPETAMDGLGGFLEATWGSAPHGPIRPYRRSMLALVVILLVIWAVLAVLGFVIKGLLWLAIAGLICGAIGLIAGVGIFIAAPQAAKEIASHNYGSY